MGLQQVVKLLQSIPYVYFSSGTKSEFMRGRRRGGGGGVACKFALFISFRQTDYNVTSLPF